jgi:ADP-heptose:LPS heptosyltransferase
MMKRYWPKTKQFPPRFRKMLDPVNTPVNRCPVSREEAETRVLIMRVGANGDITMGTPLLNALRRECPTAHITWAVAAEQAQSIDAHPVVDELLIWESLFWKGLLRRCLYPVWAFHAAKFARIVRRLHYDIFISLQPEEWPLLALAVSAPMSIGVFDTFMRYNRTSKTSSWVKYYTHAFTRDDLPDHRVRQYLLPLKALGLSTDVDVQMTVGYTASDVAELDEALAARAQRKELPLVVIAPMTTWPSKCWPRDRYAAIARRLLDRGCEVCVVGGLTDRSVVYDITYMVGRPILTIAGEFGYRCLAALIDRASLVVCGDTGPMHVAAALCTPCVSIFGATAPESFAPDSRFSDFVYRRVECSPCDQKRCGNAGSDFQKCVRAVSVEDVYAACVRNLDAHSKSSHAASLTIAG